MLRLTPMTQSGNDTTTVFRVTVSPRFSSPSKSVGKSIATVTKSVPRLTGLRSRFYPHVRYFPFKLHRGCPFPQPSSCHGWLGVLANNNSIVCDAVSHSIRGQANVLTFSRQRWLK